MRVIPMLMLVLLVCGFVRGAEPEITKMDLFESGVGGYAMYRIPALVVTAKGTALAFCEGRKSGSDWGEIDILMRRSTDGGRTWSEPARVAQMPADAKRNRVAPTEAPQSEKAITLNNPLAIAGRDGMVHLLYCVEYERCFYRRSDDDGRIFGKVVEITTTFEPFRKQFDWAVLATGPGHGIELRDGRLIAPVWLSRGKGRSAHGDSCAATIYSDDRGKSWKAGQIVADAKLVDGNETAVVELSDGRVMLNIRKPGKPNFRAVTISAGGIGGWSEVRFDEALPEPVCMGSLVRVDERRILFSNPHNPDSRERKNLTVKVSADDGATWTAARTIEPGPSGYSDLAVGADGWIYCLYERGEKKATEKLTLARFNLDWICQQP